MRSPTLPAWANNPPELGYHILGLRESSAYPNYPYSAADEVRIQLPEGFQLEYQPEPFLVDAGFGKIETQTSAGTGEVTYRKSVTLNEIVYKDSESSMKLKAFFDIVEIRDRHHLLLKEK